MKLYLLLALCALAAAAPSLEKGHVDSPVFPNDLALPHDKSFLVNVLVKQLFNYLRLIIRNGSWIFGIPRLDPLVLESYHLYIPAQIINLDLDLKNIRVLGFGDFEVQTSNLNLRTMTFDVQIKIPQIDISAEEYELVGDFYSVIPLFGKGEAKFLVDEFTFAAKVFLKQSDDGKAILMDRIEDAAFTIPNLTSGLTGVVGGGDIDAIVNAITEDVIVNYLNKFQAAIASVTSNAIVKFGNPLLAQIDSWKVIAPFIPRSEE